MTHPLLLDEIILEVLVGVIASHHHCAWPSCACTTTHHSIAFAELRRNRWAIHSPLSDLIRIDVSWLAHV
jgi:hypothetical protein